MDNGASSYHRFLNGDNTGIVELIRDYKDGLMLYLNGYVENIFVAEELMEDVFFKLVTKRPRFSGKSKFKTWLYAIGHHAAMDYLRHRARFSDAPIEDYENVLLEEELLEKTCLRTERNITVHQALCKLRPEYRQALYLRYFEGMPNSEIAVVLHKSKHQIENLVYRARISLRLELEKVGFVYEEL